MHSDVTCYFLMNDDITWAVNGLSFTDAPKNIDFRVRTDTKNIPSKLVNEVADVYPHTNLTLEHDGDFGFTALLSINVGTENEGMYANLYYYDQDKNSRFHALLSSLPQSSGATSPCLCGLTIFRSSAITLSRSSVTTLL